MLTFLTGTHFSSKKNFIYEKICSFLSEGKPVYLIVPEQAGFDRDRDFLFTYGEKLGNALTVTSFSHLYRDVLEEKGLYMKPEADTAARSVLMSIAAEQCADSLSVFRRYSSKPVLVSRLLGEYEEIKQAGYGVGEMKKAAASLEPCKLKTKLNELSLIFEVYESLIGERFSERSDSMAVMTDFLKSRKIFNGAVVFFDDFRGFTGAQIKLMTEIMSQTEECFVSVYAPDSANPYDSEAYLHAVRNCRKLRVCASLRGVTCREEKISSCRSDGALQALADSLFCSEKEIYEKKTDSVKIMCCENKYSECETVALQIKKLLSDEGYRCRDICITERDAGYAKAMIWALKKYSIPVFEDKRVPLFEYPLIKAVLSAVSIAVHGFSTEEIFSYLKTGITGIDTVRWAELENYVYIWNINGAAWKRPFTGHPKGFGADENCGSDEALSVINDTREKIVMPLLSLKRKLENGNAESSCRAVFEFITEINAAENFLSYAQFLYDSGNEAGAVECSAVWDTLIKALDSLFDAAGLSSLSPQRFFELLKIILSASDVGRIPAGIDEIIIGSAGRTRHLEPRAVFVLGCNEGIFPALPVVSGIFTVSEKRTLSKNEFTLENISENIYSEERMIAFSLLTLPTEKLYVSYSRTSPSGQALEKSEIISDIKEIIPEIGVINDKDISSFERIGSIDSAFEECALNYRENSVYSASLKKFMEESGLRDRFNAVKIAAENLPAEIKNTVTATQLFGNDMYISPSKAEVFYSCAFKYFCQYGLSISKPRQADLDARVNGLLIHYLLENILKDRKNSEITEMDDNALRREISTIAERFISLYMGGRDDKSVLLNRSLDKTKDIAFEILKRMRIEFSLSRFETRDVELSISYKGKVKPYKINLPDGGSITVSGTVDRVDVMDDGEKAYLRVVDYKTGGKDFKLSDVFDGLNMQMLIYLMCLWDNGKEHYGDIVPAGILYVPANNSGTTLGRSASDEEVVKQKLTNGKMNGMILEDEYVLDGMEKGCKGSIIIPKIDDNGKMKGAFLSIDGFIKLHKKIDSKLSEMGEKLHTGKIAAVPVIGSSSYQYTCTYCDFKDICRRTGEDECREPLSLKHEEAVELLRGEKNDG